MNSGKGRVIASDVDAGVLAEAARRYYGLRRRYWRCFLGATALLCGSTLVLISVAEYLNSFVRGLFFILMAAGFLPLWAGSVVAWFALMGFRCPACGKRFVLSMVSSWPSSTCKHCDLSLKVPCETPG